MIVAGARHYNKHIVNQGQFFLIFLAIIFFIIPGRAGWFDGVPLSQFHEIIFIAAIIIIFSLSPKADYKKQKNLLIVGIFAFTLIILKLILGGASLESGLIGQYYYPPPNETILAQTRIDPVINFKSVGYSPDANPLPLWYLNDEKFFTIPDQQERYLWPIKINWQGHIYIPPGYKTVSLTSDGETSLDLKIKGSGVYPIKISYRPSSKPLRFINLNWGDNYGNQTVKTLFTKYYAPSLIFSDDLLGIADGILKLLAILNLIIVFKITRIFPKRPFLIATLLFCLLLTGSELLNKAQSEYFNYLDVAHDPISYETFARHILKTGDWAMKIIDGPYYHQPYYYFLALIHLITGEGLFGVVFFQSLIGLFTAFIAFLISSRLLKNHWLSLAIIPLVNFYPPFFGEHFKLFPQPLGAFFAVAAVLLLLFKKNHLSFLAGASLAFSVINRYNFLSWLPFIIIWLIFTYRKQLLKPLLSFTVGLLIAFSPFLLRNQLIADDFGLFVNSISTTNFIHATQAPPDYQLSAKNNHPTILSLADKIFDDRADPSIIWIIENPIDYLKVLGNKFITALGLKNNPFGLWMLYPFLGFLIGSVFFITSKDYWLIGGFVWSQLLTLLIFSDNSERYYIPLLPFMLIASLFIFFWAIKKISWAKAGTLLRPFNK